ncbi:S1C family serine protease [Paraliobacillus ryukyuensis]|uniref:S1C family serine protease n=1 Tax=Paraliobacillus ryukyuensis TaxID=200904 RepID=UPI002118219D|nr:serine protease [Paraliobacillus ryukyuensis]
MEEKHKRDIIDTDLYEELDAQEMLDILEEERNQTNDQQTNEEEYKQKRRFPRWAFWLIALVLSLNVIAILPKTFSIPAIDFLMTSAKLSTNSTIDNYQEAVVVVQSGESKGTGFSISSDGLIITNQHVIDNGKKVSVAFPELGLYQAEIVAEDAALDLAILDVKDTNLPHLTIAKQATFEQGESIYFIGNPLRFNGIANEGEIIGYTTLKSRDEEVIMLQAPVYRGNSGSPVINKEGKVIGVIYATMNHKSHGEVGLAIPIEYYEDVKNKK